MGRRREDRAVSEDPVEVWICSLEGERNTTRSASTAFLRGVLAYRLGVEEATLAFDRTCRWCGDHSHGKPRLLRPRTSEIHFSFSRTRGLAAAVVAGDEVGIDVEHTALADIDQLIPFVLTPDEQRTSPTVGGGTPAEVFLRTWTAKEAYLKGIGLGLVANPTAITFDEDVTGWRRVRDHGQPVDWHVTGLNVGELCVGALALHSTPTAVAIERWPISP